MENIALKPYDIISVKRAEMVYVLGDVGRQDPVQLGDRESVSVLQVLSMARGLNRDAKGNRAVVLCPTANANRRTEIALNLKKVLSAQANDSHCCRTTSCMFPADEGQPCGAKPRF